MPTWFPVLHLQLFKVQNFYLPWRTNIKYEKDETRYFLLITGTIVATLLRWRVYQYMHEAIFDNRLFISSQHGETVSSIFLDVWCSFVLFEICIALYDRCRDIYFLQLIKFVASSLLINLGNSSFSFNAEAQTTHVKFGVTSQVLVGCLVY